jgi:hypothetical protein
MTGFLILCGLTSVAFALLQIAEALESCVR